MRKRKYEFRRLRRHVLIFIFILLLGLLNHLKAQPVWKGTVDSIWENPANWAEAEMPGEADDVRILSSSNFHPVISGKASCKSLILEKGARLKLSGHSVFSIHGDFFNFGELTASGIVKFSGCGKQKVSSVFPLSFSTLEIDNAAGVAVNSEVAVQKELVLKNGNLESLHSIALMNEKDDALTIYSEKSHVVGKLKRKIKPSEEGKYLFPVGLGETKKYFPARIDVIKLLGTQYITVSFSPLERYVPSYVNASDREMNYEFIAPEGMWSITPDVEPSSGWYDLRLWVGNMSGLKDNQFTILKRQIGGGPKSWIADFGEKNSFGGEGRKLSDGFALKKYCTSFSEFSVGSTGQEIQVEWLQFDAKAESGKVTLLWTSAAETNSASFTVEKSNGIDFKEVITVTAAENSSAQRSYSAVDKKPFTGISYYRLKVADFSGNIEYSQVLSVKSESSESQMTFFPNPVNGIFKIKYPSVVANTDVVVYNQHGAICFSKSYRQNRLIEMNLKEELPSGIYYMQISSAAGSASVQQCVIQ